MARKCSERVVEMKRKYIQLHNQGMSATEIAERFELTPCTVYSHLQEIADENGIDRKSLLTKDYPETRASSPVKRSSLKNVKTEDLIKEANNLVKTIDKNLNQIQSILMGGKAI